MAQQWFNQAYPLLTNPLNILATTAAVIGATVLITLAYYAFASSRPKNFPPGPATVPFLGNFHLLPTTKSYKVFQEWGRIYGPILGLKFGSKNVVVLNNYRDVQDLMEKRSGIYASRPPNYVANEIIAPGDVHILFSPYGPGWKAIRKATQALFVPRQLNHMLPIQNAEATQMIHDIIHDPKNHYKHIQRYTTAVILASVFGQRAVAYESPKIQALYDVQHRLSDILEPGATPPVDTFKFLRYIPEWWAPYKNIDACMRETLRWRPAVAGGVPHMLTQTDHYKGYVFPAGTIFFANPWALNHDENEYEDPETFNPDRWVNNRYGTRYAIDDEAKRNVLYSFGSGRRVCVGQKLAENSLRIVIAKIVWAFDISKVGDEEVDTSLDTAYKGGIAILPKEFPALIRPRSQKHVDAAEREFAGFKSFYEKFVELV